MGKLSFRIILSNLLLHKLLPIRRKATGQSMQFSLYIYMFVVDLNLTTSVLW